MIVCQDTGIPIYWVAIGSQLRVDGARLTEAELIAYCAKNMAYFMVPRYVEFRAELPRTLHTLDLWLI